MRATIDRDIIVHLTSHGDTEIGTFPPGVGLERLRWDGQRVVDLADLEEIWVEPVPGGGFLLHAVEVPGLHKVAMRYTDRRRLVLDDRGVPRLKTEQEQFAEDQAAEMAMQRALLSDQIRQAAGPLDQQIHMLRKTVYLLVEHITAPSPATSAALSDVLNEVKDVYPVDKIKTDVKEAAAAVRQAENTAKSISQKKEV